MDFSDSILRLFRGSGEVSRGLREGLFQSERASLAGDKIGHKVGRIFLFLAALRDSGRGKFSVKFFFFFFKFLF